MIYPRLEAVPIRPNLAFVAAIGAAAGAPLELAAVPELQDLAAVLLARGAITAGDLPHPEAVRAFAAARQAIAPRWPGLWPAEDGDPLPMVRPAFWGAWTIHGALTRLLEQEAVGERFMAASQRAELVNAAAEAEVLLRQLGAALRALPDECRRAEPTLELRADTLHRAMVDAGVLLVTTMPPPRTADLAEPVTE